MENRPTDVTLRITSSSELSHAHTHTLSLLYQPVIGKEAFSLYMMMHGLLDRSSMRTPTYPLCFLLDSLSLSPEGFREARKALEATGLLQTFYKDNVFLFELFQPLTANAFIKDSAYAPYLKHRIGEERFNDLIGHFQISRPKKASLKNITVHFDEVFEPVREPVETRKKFTHGETKKTELKDPVDVELVLEELPDTMKGPRMRSKRFKEKLADVAYIYSLTDKDLLTILRATVDEGDVDFQMLSKHAADHYQSQKRHIVKKNDPYSENYFKSVHPRAFLEQSTGSRAANVELRTLERMIGELELPHEVLNVLIAYVLKELEGQFPAFNYFDRVAAEWKRNNIRTAGEAIEHVKRVKQKQKDKKQSVGKYQKSYRKRDERPEDTNVDWFEDYLKKQEE